MKKINLILFLLIFALFAQTANADFFEYKSDAAGTIWLTADLEIAGNLLTVTLSNISTQPTASPSAAFSSFYFDIIGDPVLTGFTATATGGVYEIDDALVDTWQDNGSILAGTRLNYVGNTDGWQYKDTNAGSFPYLGYGIGTVGNNTYPNLITDTANQFNGGLVDGLDYSIISNDDVTTNNLKSSMLVKGSATFTFVVPDGYDNSNIGGTVGFGLGTGPDNFVFVPVPGAVLLGILGLGVVGIKMRKYA